MQVVKNETVTVSSGNTLTQNIDSTIVTDWDEDEPPMAGGHEDLIP